MFNSLCNKKLQQQLQKDLDDLAIVEKKKDKKKS